MGAFLNRQLHLTICRLISSVHDTVDDGTVFHSREDKSGPIEAFKENFEVRRSDLRLYAGIYGSSVCDGIAHASRTPIVSLVCPSLRAATPVWTRTVPTSADNNPPTSVSPVCRSK